MRVWWMVVLMSVFGAGKVQQLLKNPSFASDSPSSFYWEPYLSGYYVDNEHGNVSRGDTSCLSFTPNHFYGVWQGVRVSEKKQKAENGAAIIFTLVAHVNTEWMYDASLAVSVDFRYTDGTNSVDNALSFVNGRTGYQRACLSLLVPQGKVVEFATVFVVATPVTSSFGTVFVDDVELWTSGTDVEHQALCPQEKPRLAAGDFVQTWTVAKTGSFPSSSSSAVGHQACAVLTLDLGQVDYIAQLAELWRLPIVAVVAVPNEKDVEAEYERITKSVATFRSVKVIIVSAGANEAENWDHVVLPVNFMRNVGETACSAPFVLHLEYGMLPSGSLNAAFFQKYFVPPKNSVYVVPSFLVQHSQQLSDREALIALAKTKRVSPAQVGRHALSYFSTNYTHWMTGSPAEPYRISLILEGSLSVAREMGTRDDELDIHWNPSSNLRMLNRHYSPVLLVPRGHAVWDERFTHRGHARASYLVELFLRKTQVLVLPDVFVTLPDSSVSTLSAPPSVAVADASSMWKAYYGFLSEKLITLSNDFATDAVLLRAMPPHDPSVDHRVERALWKRMAIASATIGVAGLILRHLLSLPHQHGGGGPASAVLNSWYFPSGGPTGRGGAVKEL